MRSEGKDRKPSLLHQTRALKRFSGEREADQAKRITLKKKEVTEKKRGEDKQGMEKKPPTFLPKQNLFLVAERKGGENKAGTYFERGMDL